MKRSWQRVVGLVCILAVCAASVFALGACGKDNAVKYTYSEIKFAFEGEGADSMSGSAGSMLESMLGTYNALFADSYIKVSDTKIKWEIKEVGSQTLKVSKDGDKQVISGDYCDSLSQVMSAATGSGTTVDWYGVKTDEGYELVMQITIPEKDYGYGVTVPGFTEILRYVFVKA